MSDIQVHKQKQVGLVQIKPLEDNTLSSEAKGVFAILQAVLSKDSEITIEELVPYVKEYAETIERALGELKEKGYVVTEEENERI